MREDIPRLCLWSTGLTMAVLYIAGATKPLVITSALLANLYLGAAYWTSAKALWFDIARKRAWVLTLAIATILAPAGVGSAVYMAMTGDLWRPEAYFASTPVGDAAVAAFLAFLVADCVVGSEQYREQFGLLEGWVHHVGYLVVCAAALKSPFSSGMAPCMVIEVTTVILAVGHIWPAYRADLLFGVAFFLIRIVYCVFVMVVVMGAPNLPPIVPLFGTTAILMHAHWFRKWCIGQWRRGCTAQEASGDSGDSEVTPLQDVTVECGPDRPKPGRATRQGPGRGPMMLEETPEARALLAVHKVAINGT